MNEQAQTHSELSSEISVLKRKITELEQSESERKRASEALRMSEEYFKAIIQNSSDIILILDKLGIITYASPSTERFLGYEPDELIGKKTLDLIVSDDKSRAITDFGRALLTKEVPIPNIFRIKHKNGTERILEGFGKNLLDNPIVAGFVVNVRDITERKQAEEALHLNREIAERLAQEMAIIAEIGRLVGSTLDLNQVYERVATEAHKLIPYDRLLVCQKISDNQFIVAYVSGIDNPGRRMGNLYPRQGSATDVVMNTRTGILIQPTNAEEIKDLYPNLYETFKTGLRSTMSVPLISMDEVVGSMNFRSEKLKAYTEQDLQLAERIGMQIAGAISNAQLYQELKEVETSLREGEGRFRGLFEQAAVGVAEIEMSTGCFITVNRRLCELVGRTKEELLATTFQAIIHPEDSRLHEEKSALLSAGKIGHYSMEKRYLRKDGEIVWVNITVSPLWKSGETNGCNMIVVEDITKRKQTEEALRESEDRYRTLVENANDIVFRMDDTGHVTFVNPAALRITAYEEKEIIGRHYPTFIRPDMQEEAIKFFGRQFVKGIPNTYSEYPVIVKDGHEIWLGQNTQLIFQDGKVIAFQAVARDITDRKRMEEDLRESEKKYRALSIVDELTQLYNSRHFYVQLKSETERSNRYRQPLTLLLLDLDDFKAFNDAYGHVEGDQVLMRLGRVIKRCLREADSAYRYGGEEFTILLPMTTSMDGIVTAQRIRTEFKQAFSPAPGRNVHVTLSIGLAQYKAKEDRKVFVDRVDQLMYQGKKNGKDRVCSEP